MFFIPIQVMLSYALGLGLHGFISKFPLGPADPKDEFPGERSPI